MFRLRSYPKSADLWFLPLGGTGEIGMNMNLYGHDSQWLIVDCGVTFENPTKENGLDKSLVLAADPRFIVQHKNDVAGMVITHAHEDHVGAVAYVWPDIECPVYATPFTAEILRRKLAQTGLLTRVPIIEVEFNQEISIGPFNVRYLPTTHSLPEPSSIVIKTPAATVLHTADWKLDADPVVGTPFNAAPFKALSGLDAMICDSTNSTVAGHSRSEGACYQGLLDTIRPQTGRVVVACFGSNIARLISLAKIAQETGRYFGLFGRSLHNMVSAAKKVGIWPSELSVADSSHLGYLPAHQVLAVATGSQGEPRTALFRLATGTLWDLDLEAGDTVIFSSRVIPGNEAQLQRLVNALKHKQITIIDSDNSPVPIHASGHPCQEEVRALYQWVQPRLAIPTHGEAEHLAANAELATQAGVPIQLTGKNGDLFQIAPKPRLRKDFTATGRIELKR